MTDTAEKIVRTALRRVVESRASLASAAAMWVADRVENREPLLFNNFVEVAGELGHDKIKAREMKDKMVARYTRLKAAYKKQFKR